MSLERQTTVTLIREALAAHPPPGKLSIIDVHTFEPYEFVIILVQNAYQAGLDAKDAAIADMHAMKNEEIDRALKRAEDAERKLALFQSPRYFVVRTMAGSPVDRVVYATNLSWSTRPEDARTFTLDEATAYAKRVRASVQPAPPSPPIGSQS